MSYIYLNISHVQIYELMIYKLKSPLFVYDENFLYKNYVKNPTFETVSCNNLCRFHFNNTIIILETV